MQKIVSFLAIILLAIPAVSFACAKNKKASPVAQCASQPSLKESVTILVVDSNWSLIPNATLRLSDGKTLSTGWDGRLVLSAAQATGKMTLSCDNYDTVTLSLSKSDCGQTLFFCLTQKEVKVSRPRYRASGPGPVMLYSKASRSSRAAATDMVEDGEMMVMESKVMASAASVDAVAPEVYESAAMVEEAGAAITGYSVHKPVADNNISAGRLTAGEVNDFAKWNLWGKVFDGSHQKYVADWRLYTNRRYVVQIVSADNYPVANRPVSLLDGLGNTLYQAVTDNTGRAELWAGLTGEETPSDLIISAEGHNMPAVVFSANLGNVNTLRLSAEESKDVCPSSDADVFFIFDATGSMGDELRYLQAEMKDVIARSQSAVDGLNIRTGALVYRDHSDDYVTRISRLSNDIQTTQSFIDKQSAGGGGDYEEAIPEALMASLNAAGWNEEARTRIAFLILDAPCHQDSTTIALLHEQVRNAAAMGVRLVPVVCSGLQESGELLMRSLALATNGTSFFLTDDSGIGDTHLKPTTDSLKVEHLNDMLVRTIISFTRMPECQVAAQVDSAALDSLLATDDVERFLPNPFNTDDLDSVPAALPLVPVEEVLLVRPNPCSGFCLASLPKGADALFLVDCSGKTIRSYGAMPADTADLSLDVSGLSTGVYFVKAFVGGRWYTQKLIVRQ